MRQTIGDILPIRNGIRADLLSPLRLSRQWKPPGELPSVFCWYLRNNPLTSKF